MTFHHHDFPTRPSPERWLYNQLDQIDLSPAARQLYQHILLLSIDRFQITMSNAELGAELKVHPNTICRAMRKLRDLDMVTTVKTRKEVVRNGRKRNVQGGNIIRLTYRLPVGDDRPFINGGVLVRAESAVGEFDEVAH